MDKSIINYLSEQFELSVNPEVNTDQLEAIIAERINYLVMNDFHRLLRLLYRIDISETKLKSLLSSNPEVDSGRIIARMIIERQMEKIRLREYCKITGTDAGEEEKW